MEQQTQNRLDALPSAAEVIVGHLIPELMLSSHRDEFFALFFEAHSAYLHGCPRSSVIVAGESLLRAVFAQIESTVIQQKTALSVRVRGGVKVVGVDFEVQELDDNLSFCEALGVLKQNQMLPDATLEIAYAVKDLRNSAAHGRFPLLDYWDPDDPRPASEWMQLIIEGKHYEWPEGYRFRPSKHTANWLTFDCRRHCCNSLKRLGIEEQYAAIQYCLVVQVIEQMFKTTIQPGNRVRHLSTNATGTVIESDNFSRIYRSVKWDDGITDDLVEILTLEKLP